VASAGPLVRGAGGVDLATWDLGGDGPPLLLAHATGFHGRCWLPLAPSLTERFHVWAYDHRGHGSSGHAPDGDYRDWARFVDDCLAVVDRLGLPQPWAAGHSLGGAVLLLAEQRRPGTFRALYCYEPVVIPDSAGAAAGGNGDGDLSVLARKRRNVFADREAAWANYRAKPPYSRFTPEALSCYVAYGLVDRPDGTVALACPGEEEATVYEGAPHQPAYRQLPELRLPVTVAGSADGSALGAELLRHLAERIPGGRSEILEGLSHFGPMEDPERIAAAIAETCSG
jgi:pimeloyl-ACP methyl ester carboxylesterase